MNYFHSNGLIIIPCIYINEFRYSLPTTECGHFAEDTFITFASKNIITIETVMNYDFITPAHIENINFSHSKYHSLIGKHLDQNNTVVHFENDLMM